MRRPYLSRAAPVESAGSYAAMAGHPLSSERVGSGRTKFSMAALATLIREYRASPQKKPRRCRKTGSMFQVLRAKFVTRQNNEFHRLLLRDEAATTTEKTTNSARRKTTELLRSGA